MPQFQIRVHPPPKCGGAVRLCEVAFCTQYNPSRDRGGTAEKGSCVHGLYFNFLEIILDVKSWHRFFSRCHSNAQGYQNQIVRYCRSSSKFETCCDSYSSGLHAGYRLVMATSGSPSFSTVLVRRSTSTRRCTGVRIIIPVQYQ